uniref:Uncharacterized protein n=1 Tax=Davidia involucrata TaxID=16924 RepID=A0A5B7C1F1_DAVIN
MNSMEEREREGVSPAGNGDHDNNPPLPQTQSISPAQTASHDHPLPETSHQQAFAFPSGTYVIQVPKDQIYRVPPPKDALLAECHRNPPRQNKSCCTCFLCIFIITLILGLVGGITSIFLKRYNPT